MKTTGGKWATFPKLQEARLVVFSTMRHNVLRYQQYLLHKLKIEKQMTKLAENNLQCTANIADDRVLATVLRPKMASEALELIEQEMENQYVFAFMRCAENHKMRNLKFKCSINKYNKGWTAISK